jgi:hypothetical protein
LERLCQGNLYFKTQKALKKKPLKELNFV